MKRLLSALLFAVSLPALAAVNLNSATQAELESVKGIGPAKAKAIIDYRQKNGPFTKLEDLDQVKGFGPASIAKMKGELTVEGVKKTSETAKKKP